MILNSYIKPEGVKAALTQLEEAPYFLEQVDLQDSATTKRKTYSFGYNYFSLLENNRNFTLIPTYLQTLCQQCIDSFPKELALGEAQDYKNAIVSFYEPGYSLEPHYDVDVDQYTEGKDVDFYFGENIIGVILVADSSGKLYFSQTDDDSKRLEAPKLFELEEKLGTTYLMAGKYRRKPYYHGVSKVDKLRISVSFRTIQFSS